jgi:hypothetical protein
MSYSAIAQGVYRLMMGTLLALLCVVAMAVPVSAMSARTSRGAITVTSSKEAIVSVTIHHGIECYYYYYRYFCAGH